jgi:hypothetical protein
MEKHDKSSSTCYENNITSNNLHNAECRTITSLLEETGEW